MNITPVKPQTVSFGARVQIEGVNSVKAEILSTDKLSAESGNQKLENLSGFVKALRDEFGDNEKYPENDTVKFCFTTSEFEPYENNLSVVYQNKQGDDTLWDNKVRVKPLKEILQPQNYTELVEKTFVPIVNALMTNIETQIKLKQMLEEFKNSLSDRIKEIFKGEE